MLTAPSSVSYTVTATTYPGFFFYFLAARRFKEICQIRKLRLRHPSYPIFSDFRSVFFALHTLSLRRFLHTIHRWFPHSIFAKQTEPCGLLRGMCGGTSSKNSPRFSEKYGGRRNKKKKKGRNENKVGKQREKTTRHPNLTTRNISFFFFFR